MATITSKRKAHKSWYKVLEHGELPEGRVTTRTCRNLTICLSRYGGEYGALDNKCPHQGGPLGEGSIESGFLRCPWHGWDFNPITGESPGGFDDGVPTYEIEERDDGIYVALEDEGEHKQTITDLMAETMVNWGVKQVFGMVGHSNLGLADALRVQEEAGNLSYYGIRHEGAASFACSAYGKLTGRPAACLGIAGPGSTNLLTGLWDANVDRSPVLALSGQVDTQVLGPGAFQEIDLQAAFGKVAQWSQTVLPSSKHAELINLALKSAILNRGVSHLVFPDEVQTLAAPEKSKAGSPVGRVTPLTISPPKETLNEAIKLLKNALRPSIIVGHGARFNMDSIIELAEMLKCPVFTTFKGKGLISDDHPLGCGVLGRSGTPIASWFMNESDLLVVFGASFSNHTGISSKKPIIHVDYDNMALAKFHPVTVPVWGEIGITADLIKKGLRGKAKSKDRRKEIAKRWKIWRDEKKSRRKDSRNMGLSSAYIFDELSKLVNKNAIITVDVGNNTYSFGRYFECRSQAILMSGYLGSIGFSLPAALGAWSATQEDDPRFKGRQVVSVSVDGGFGQYLAEVTTAVKYGMNITHILLHNKELGKISKEQRAGNWEVWQTSLHNPNFADFVNSCGGLGIRVKDKKELTGALKKCLKHKTFSLVEIMSDVELI
ncbi:MAG: Rieske 2Fe-2S domain-containing protein [Candidatus Dadabacteria bacterium]|nr:Rieske 2Fe-2S domain-containing protein [Candidatus Dadabacteria bacterium]